MKSTSLPSSSSAPIKVLIIDDSALVRALLKEILESDPRLTVVAAAKDAYEARELIKRYNPDVLTLDIEMPKMNGIVFLSNLMRLRPMPVVMISTLTQAGAPATLEALELGAVDFVAKPKTDSGAGLEDYGREIIEKVASAAKARLRPPADEVEKENTSQRARQYAKLFSNKSPKKNFICAIGASTGGTEAIKEVISSLPANSPPIVVVQHIPESFSASYAARVNNVSVLNVVEAKDNQKIEAGTVYIAPGHSHLKVVSYGGAYFCRLDGGDPVNRHRPSVDVLFDSVADCAKNNAMGVLLTGMGADGAKGLLRLRELDCHTVAQDEESSIVWGMPGSAVKLGAAQKILPLHKIATEILSVGLV